MNDNIFGIELVNGSCYIIYTDYKTTKELAIAINESDWIAFKTNAQWNEKGEFFDFENSLFKTSEIISISW